MKDNKELLCNFSPLLANTILDDIKLHALKYVQGFNSVFRFETGYYFTGDGARRDIDGHYQITGRVDDVINVKGVRLGTAEVEDIMVGINERI